MPKYECLEETYLSHENRKVFPGDIFETEFPLGPTGQPMKLGRNLRLIDGDEKPHTKPAAK